MKSFQTILLIVFAFFIVGAVLIFSGVLGGKKAEEKLLEQPIVMWGTIPKSKIDLGVMRINSSRSKIRLPISRCSTAA